MGKALKILRAAAGLACVAALLLMGLGCLDIYMDGEGFSAAAVGERFGILAPWLALCLAVVIAAVFAGKGEKIPRSPQCGKLYRPEKKSPSAGKLFAARLAILTLAAAFILLGVLNGGARDVLVKAINICTECIGLG